MNTDRRRLEMLEEAMARGDRGAAEALLAQARRRGDGALALACAVALGWSSDFARVEEGRFLMGSSVADPEAPAEETPARWVTLSRPVWLAKTPLTQAQWTALMGHNPSRHRGDPACPVEQVSWYDAVAACNALSRRLGLPEAYRLEGARGEPGRAGPGGGGGFFARVRWAEGAPGVRLPTEAEWERAARGLDGAPGEWLGRAWFAASSGGRPRPVGRLPPGPRGLYDLHGGVWEWCWDRRAPYDPGDVLDPTGPARGGLERVARGGAFSSLAGSVGSTRRRFLSAHARAPDVGVRLALTWPDAPPMP